MTLRKILAATCLLLPILAHAHNFETGQRVPPVGVADRGELILDNSKFSYKAWNSAQLPGKVRVVQHIAGRTSAKEKNAALVEAIKSANLPHDRYQTTTIINTDDAMYQGAGNDLPQVLTTEPTEWDRFEQSAELHVPAMSAQYYILRR